MIAQITLHVNLENVSILVQNQMCVLQMQIVELQNMSQYALVQMDLWAHLSYRAQDHQDLNALQILNAQTILHALGTNARIPASPQLVELMLNAGFKGTELSVSVGQGMREIPTASVKNLVVRVTMSVLSLKLASKENVKIHVPMNSVASKLSAL
jgi:hypothetical protein